MAEKKTKAPEAEAPELDLAEMQAQIAAMMAEAKAAREEAAAILAEAKAAAAPKDGGMSAEERAAKEAYMNEYVEVALFKDSDKYKDDVIVGCNGEFVAIKRGERVKVKRKHAEILDHSAHQDYETSELINRKSDEFAKSGL